jgi:hypothetical protein
MSSRVIPTVVAAALVLAPTAATAQAPAVGVNAAVRNDVQIRPAGTNRLKRAVVRDKVLLNDEVRTGASSLLQILLLDRSTFTVGANSRVAVDRFVYDPARNTRSTGISVTRGAFRFMSGRALGKPAGPASVRTPVASIGIRGTIFEGAVGAEAMRLAALQPAVGPNPKGDAKGATFVVLRGPGPRAQGDTGPGAIDVQVGSRVITLDRPGMALYVPGAGLPPIGPFQISPAGLQAMQTLLRTTPGMAPAVALARGAGQIETTGGSGASPSGGSEGAPRGAGAGAGAGKGRFPFLAGGGLAAAILTLVLLNSGDDKDDPPQSP